MRLIRLSLILIILHCVHAPKAQSTWQDSLTIIKGDTTKLSYLAKLFDPLVYSNPKEALIVAAVHDSISKETGILKEMAYSNNMYGMAYYVSLDFGQAIDYYLHALNYYEDSDDFSKLARVLNNIATCYQNRSDTEKSTSYFIRALDIYERLKDSLWIGSINSNLSLQYLYDDNLEQSEYHIDKAVPILKSVGHDIYLGISYLNRGNLYIQQQRFEEAIVDYNESIQLIPEAVSPLVHAASFTGLGSAYRQLDDYNQALIYLKKGLTKAEMISNQEQLKETHRELAALYESTGRSKLALVHFKQHAAFKDSVFTLAQDEKLADALVKYESEKKEKEIATLNLENQLSEASLKSSRKQTLGLTIGALMLSFLLFGLFRLFRKTQSQNGIIRRALNDKNVLLKEIHHRVKNNLQVISALLTLQSTHLKDAHAKEALREGQDRVESMALIHKDLYQHDNLKGVNTKDYLEKLIDSLLSSYNVGSSEIEVTTEIEELLLDVDTMIPLGLTINELISNALKHAYKDEDEAKLKVYLKEEGEVLKLTIQDNGKGIGDIDVLKQKSFGYSLIQSFARKLDAELDIQSNHGLLISLYIKNYKKQ